MEYRNWTSFNSGKLFSHIERWKLIQRNQACPPPVLITVDLSNYCNLSCEWCNAKEIRKNKRMLSKSVLLNFAGFISEWKSVNGRYGVEAVCIAGGGEPLCNPYVGDFLLELSQRKINVATVTNGILIDKYLDELLENQYVAVSVDAGTSATYNKYKGLDEKSDTFNKVISNIELLCQNSQRKKCNLGRNSLSNGVNYRMLLYRDNIKEISESAKIAQEIGCRSLHIRPAAIPYDSEKEFIFTDEDIELFKEQVHIVEKNKKPEFGFYYTLGKFDKKFNKCNDFECCYAIFMTATLMPPTKDGGIDSYCLNVCCDRRSDQGMRLLVNESKLEKISQIWGSDLHWQIHDSLSKEQIEKVCPRCTYYEHNKIYENCIVNDNMLINFI